MVSWDDARPFFFGRGRSWSEISDAFGAEGERILEDGRRRGELLYFYDVQLLFADISANRAEYQLPGKTDRPLLGSAKYRLYFLYDGPKVIPTIRTLHEEQIADQGKIPFRLHPKKATLERLDLWDAPIPANLTPENENRLWEVVRYLLEAFPRLKRQYQATSLVALERIGDNLDWFDPPPHPEVLCLWAGNAVRLVELLRSIDELKAISSVERPKVTYHQPRLDMNLPSPDQIKQALNTERTAALSTARKRYLRQWFGQFADTEYDKGVWRWLTYDGTITDPWGSYSTFYRRMQEHGGRQPYLEALFEYCLPDVLDRLNALDSEMCDRFARIHALQEEVKHLSGTEWLLGEWRVPHRCTAEFRVQP